jgi:hypothetical protein
MDRSTNAPLTGAPSVASGLQDTAGSAQSRYKCDVGRNSRHVCLTPQGPTSRDVSVCAKRRHSERYFDCGIIPVTEFNP